MVLRISENCKLSKKKKKKKIKTLISYSQEIWQKATAPCSRLDYCRYQTLLSNPGVSLIYSVFEFEGLVNLTCDFVTCCDPFTSIFSSASRNCKVSLESVWMHNCIKCDIKQQHHAPAGLNLKVDVLIQHSNNLDTYILSYKWWGMDLKMDTK